MANRGSSSGDSREHKKAIRLKYKPSATNISDTD